MKRDLYIDRNRMRTRISPYQFKKAAFVSFAFVAGCLVLAAGVL